MANGDIFAPWDAVKILQFTGAELAMIGRGAFGNPRLFRQALAAPAGPGDSSVAAAGRPVRHGCAADPLGCGGQGGAYRHFRGPGSSTPGT